MMLFIFESTVIVADISVIIVVTVAVLEEHSWFYWSFLLSRYDNF